MLYERVFISDLDADGGFSPDCRRNHLPVHSLCHPLKPVYSFSGAFRETRPAWGRGIEGRYQAGCPELGFSQFQLF